MHDTMFIFSIFEKIRKFPSFQVLLSFFKFWFWLGNIICMTWKVHFFLKKKQEIIYGNCVIVSLFMSILVQFLLIYFAVTIWKLILLDRNESKIVPLQKNYELSHGTKEKQFWNQTRKCLWGGGEAYWVYFYQLVR